MIKGLHHSHSESPLDKADYNIKQWLIENTRTPRLPLFRDSILRPLNIENTQPFLEVSQFVTHEGKDLLESGLVLLQYDKTLSNLVGLAVQDADRKTVYIGQQGITAFNIEQSIRKDLVLCSSKLPIAIKAAETGYQVALSDYKTLHSHLDKGVMLLDCNDLFAGKTLAELTAKEMRRLIDDAAKQEKEKSLKAQHLYSLDEIRYSSDKTAAEILDQLNKEQDPFKCAQLAYAYTFKTLPNIPYKESLKGVRAKLEGKLNGVMLDLILERAQWILNDKKKQALKAITIHDTKQHRHLVINNFDELNDLNYKGVILLKAPTGTGKTRNVGKPFADWCMGGNLPFLAIAHRTSLISELSNTLNTGHYKVEQETYQMASKMGIDPQGSINSLAVCINSLDSEAFSKFIRSVKHLFIDEITQVLEAFNSDTSFVTSKEKTDARLRQLIAEAECVIVADANINQDTLTFIESCRPNERFNIVEIKPKNEKKIVYIHSTKESVINKIVRDINGHDKNVWVACDSAERARDADRVINGNYDINSFLITRSTTKSKAKKFLDNIDQESKKYQAIIASPTISSGVSVEHRDANGTTQPHFDYVAGILTGHSVTSRDAYQMLGRVRYAKEFHLFIDQKFTPYIDAETKKEAWQNLSGEKGTALTDLIATIQANNEMDKASFANNLYYLLEYYGFEIRRAEYSINAAIEHELKEARAEIKEADRNGILNANPITEEVANKYRRSLDLTDTEVYELRAYDKRMQLNLPFDAVLTEQDLNINMAQVMRYNAVFGHHKAVRDKATDIALRDYTKQAADIFKGIFKELNITGGAIFSDSQARSVLKRIEPHQKYLAAIGFIPKSFAQKKETKTAVKRLKLLLEHFGIKTDGKRIDNPALRKKSDTLSILSIDKLHEVSENDGAKVYRIDGASIEAMEQLADRYAIKTKTIELKTVSDQVQDKEPSNESPYFADMPSNAGFYAIDPDDDYWQTGTG
ncbi:plasmid replication protein, CyRepA1 family [Acinetobacter radioresistens]|uniref:plasmid replication protein, CyRepA1 family n=2 Tax=Acinetobacter radioresistens TaxID=40216 RepID=UPI00028EC803|nr:plasmid replication protein, CyRepA1 family [Acinetobacter radioresistens]BBL22539.1 hypothetical protein ACRAD_32100 [Acinetobacter radioresistens DSM 6976 = NBRC 102413 = CIP 103788]